MHRHGPHLYVSQSWTCPTDRADSDQACDPCSRDWSGNFEHIHCRGAGGRYGEGSIGKYDGEAKSYGGYMVRYSAARPDLTLNLIKT